MILKEYLAYLQKYPNKEEIQYRTSFENFFKDFTNELNIKNIVVIQEDRDSGIETEGTPDFFVYREHDKQQSKFFVGFIECKKPTTDLDKIKESEQIKKYEKTTDNIILTNYHRFILLRKGKPEHDITLSDDTNAIQRFENLLKDFYSYTYPHIKTKKTLVVELAKQSFYYSVELREYIDNKTNEKENFYTKFNGLFTEYQTSISYHYELTDFCDIYSQSLVYGLMLARLDTNKDLDEERLNYLQDIKEYKLLYEFLLHGYVDDDKSLPTSLKRALISIGKNINMIDTEAIQNEFNKTGEGKQHIAVFLYEDFLQAYDNLKKTEKRKESGVYYTPAEATNFITRSVNEIIKTRFNLQDGYLADRIKILDFACGTGTFLHSVFEEMLESNKDDLSKEIIRNKIETDIYGFELLFVPYIISHTILTRFLKENGINLNKRLGIFLTNTLDISQHSISSLLPNLKNEYEKAMDVKSNEHILAIIGNPPYFVGKSQSINEVIDRELKEYKKNLNEKKISLDDLYVKFIRFAEWKLEKQKQGIIGIITNNSYLDGVNHRQMRKHLYETFDEIYIVNLHGNTRKQETDKNIFDIMQGVAIAIFVKLSKKTTKKAVKYFSTIDNNIITRPEKLDFLQDTKFKKVKWKVIEPTEPNYWFANKDFSLQDEYNKFWKLTNIFENYNSGIETQNDFISIHYNKQSLDKVIEDFINLSEHNIATKYGLEDTRDWKVSTAKDDLIANKGKDLYSEIYYKAFDKRTTFFTGKTKGFIAYPRYDTMKHFEKENIGLIFSRNVEGNYTHCYISDCIVGRKTSGTFFCSYLAPLYLYKDYDKIFEKESRTPNFTVEFSAFLKTLDFKPKPEKILAYIYAILHSPIYRKKYIEFLKTDFPAIPFTKDKTTFEKYAKLGQKLIDLHLLREIPKDDKIKVSNIPQSDFIIDKITYIDNKLLLHTTENKIISIEGITKEIYNFEIGSYKPIDKWLKYRKKDSVPLNSKDLKHIKDMAVAIKETIPVMSEIGSLGEEYLK